MDGWIKGFVSSLLLLLIGAFAYLTWISAGPTKTLVALLCAVISAALFLILIYAIENDDFTSGAGVPIVAALGILIAYFGQPPFDLTLALCFFGSTFAVISVQEWD